VFFKENFSNYTDFAPGVTSGVEGISIGNDPIGAQVSTGTSAEINISAPEKGGYPVFAKNIRLPNLKEADIQFRFRTLNAAPGNAKQFEVLVNNKVIKIGSDFVSVDGQKVNVPFRENRRWEHALIRIHDGKLTLNTSVDRKLQEQLEIPFPEPVNALNFNALPKNGFSLTEISVTKGEKIYDNPVEKHFADFRSLSQPLPAGAVMTNVTLTPSKNGFAGARIKLNQTDKPLNMTLVWSNGKKETYPITAKDIQDTIRTNVGKYKQGQKVTLPDADIRIGPKYFQ